MVVLASVMPDARAQALGAAVVTNPSATAVSPTAADCAAGTGLDTATVPAAAAGFGSVAIGCGATSNPAQAADFGGNVAIGLRTFAGAAGSNTGFQTAIGALAYAAGDAATAVGGRSRADGVSATAVNGLALADRSIAIGGTSTYGADSIAIGYGSSITQAGSGAVALGVAAKVDAVDALALGHGAASARRYAIAIGADASGNGDAGIALGYGAKSNAILGVAVGGGAEAAAASTALGPVARGGPGGVAIGYLARAGVANDGSIVPETFDTLAIGHRSEATGSGAVALGGGAVASGARSISIGSADSNGSGASRATGSRAAAIGTGNDVSGTASGAFGNDNRIEAADAFVLGNGIRVASGLDGAVVLGSGSSVAASTIASYQAGRLAPVGVVLPSRVVSVGAPAAERRITNVAPGGNDTDAVNVSQLRSLAAELADADASQATPYLGVNSTGGGNATGAGATGADAIAVGQAASAAGASAVAIGRGASAGNANSVALGAASTTAAPNPIANAVVPGANGTSYAYQGFAGANNVIGVLSVGGGSGGQTRQITNVAPGAITANSTDVINGSQLFRVTSGLNERIDAMAAGATGQKGDKGDKGDPGEAGRNGLDADTQGAVVYGRDADGKVDGSSVVLNPGGAPTTVKNLADGVDGSDAATVNQLRQVGSELIAGQIGNPGAGTVPAVAVGRGSIAIGSGAIVEGSNSVVIGSKSSDDGRDNVLSVGAIGGERQIINVAEGTRGTDAVNLNQLNRGVQAANQYTDQRFNQLQGHVDQVARNAYAGVASAMAVQMPGTHVPGKTVLRVGTAYFKGEAALGVSFRRTAEDNGWSLTGGLGMSRAGVGATVGAEWVFN
ncbi:MAG: hypothetical protein EOO24_10355 [Comamonadaceae bacterium]|nr:MAG: hypothetical protein EOO24_10355 [Comamonadaceae bacterium]